MRSTNMDANKRPPQDIQTSNIGPSRPLPWSEHASKLLLEIDVPLVSRSLPKQIWPIQRWTQRKGFGNTVYVPVNAAAKPYVSLPSNLTFYLLLPLKYHPYFNANGAFIAWQLHMIRQTWHQLSFSNNWSFLSKCQLCSLWNTWCYICVPDGVRWICSVVLKCHLKTTPFWLSQPAETWGTGGSSQLCPCSAEAPAVCSWLSCAATVRAE